MAAWRGSHIGTETGRTSCLVGGDAGQGAGKCPGPCSASTPIPTGSELEPDAILSRPPFPHLSEPHFCSQWIVGWELLAWSVFKEVMSQTTAPPVLRGGLQQGGLGP